MWAILAVEQERESLDWGNDIGGQKQYLDLGVYFEDGADRFPIYSMAVGKEN